jgi:hypothetical protein
MRKKEEVITFKSDKTLLKALEKIPNRSEFIRHAILSALNNTCPLCSGTGILNPHQQEHWQRFLETHSLEQCEKCESFHLACNAEENHKDKK